MGQLNQIPFAGRRCQSSWKSPGIFAGESGTGYFTGDGRWGKKIGEEARPGEGIALDPQDPVWGGLDAPAHEQDPAPIYLQTGDPARVGASAGVEVGRIAVDGKRGAVRVTADHWLLRGVDPAREGFFDFAAFLDVLGGAGGVMDAKQLEGPPQPVDEKLDKFFEVDF